MNVVISPIPINDNVKSVNLIRKISDEPERIDRKKFILNFVDKTYFVRKQI